MTRSAWLVCTNGEWAVRGLRFPLNGSFRWARHLTCAATTLSAIFHHGRWLRLFFFFVLVRLASCLHWVTRPLGFRKPHYEREWRIVHSRLMSLNEILSVEILLVSLDKLQLGAFSLSPGHLLSSSLPLLLSVWGKKSLKKKNEIMGSESDCSRCCNRSSFLRICFPFFTFVNFWRCFCHTGLDYWNYMLEFGQFMIPPDSEGCWSSRETWCNYMCLMFVPFLFFACIPTGVYLIWLVTVWKGWTEDSSICPSKLFFLPLYPTDVRVKSQGFGNVIKEGSVWRAE